MLYYAALLSMLLALLPASGPLHAQEIQITGNEARAPKIFNDLRGEAQGLLIEVMGYVQRETGLRFSYTLFPWARAYREAANGQAGIIGISKTKDRLAQFDFSKEPLFYDELVLVVMKGREFNFHGIADLRGKRVGVCRDCSYGDAYERAVKEGLFEPIAASSTGSQLNMLLLGRIDAVLMQSGALGLAHGLRDQTSGVDLRGARDQFVILPKPFARDPNYVAFAKSRNSRAILDRVDKAIAKGNRTGELKMIQERYIAQQGIH